MVDELNQGETMDKKIEILVEIFKDYIPVKFTSSHVSRWLSQFEERYKEVILDEIIHIFKDHYYSREKFSEYITRPELLKDITGDNPKKFWSNVSLLSLQKDEKSQTEMTNIVMSFLKEEYEIDVDVNNNKKNTYVYFDDYNFTGATLYTCLKNWVNNLAPQKATLNLIFFEEAEGTYYTYDRLKDVSRGCNKDIKFNTWCLFSIENRMKNSNSSDIAWPLDKADDIKAQEIIEKTNCKKRKGANVDSLFSSEKNRKIIEEQFLIAGENILDNIAKKGHLRPLGFHRFDGFGFGAMTATYRKCPNTAPLALWWGKFLGEYPLNTWYPLLPRDPMRPFQERRSIFSGARKKKN